MTEKQIEQYLVCQVRAMGGVAYKFVSPGHNGVPDRMVCLPGAHAVFVELKKPGGTLTKLQQHAQATLRKLGFLVFTCWDKEGVDGVLALLGGNEA